MPKTPSKYTSRGFLTELQNNHYISASGVEYCAPEVDQLLIEKESEAPLPDWDVPSPWVQAEIKFIEEMRQVLGEYTNDTSHQTSFSQNIRHAILFVARACLSYRQRGKAIARYFGFVARAIWNGPGLLLASEGTRQAPNF